MKPRILSGFRLPFVCVPMERVFVTSSKPIDNTPYKVYTINMSGKDFVKKLMKDGWTLDRINGSHYIMCKDNVTLSVPVHKNEDLDKGINNQLLKKAGYKK